MIELIIVRHAIAFERDEKRWPEDRSRPLSPDGRHRFRQAASGLARWFPKVDLLLTSPLERARQTAQILTEVAGWPRAAERAELDPGTDPAMTLTSLRQPRVDRLALVGHEPHLSHLIELCVAEPSARLQMKLKKGAVAVIWFESAIRAGSGQLLALVPPRLLRTMA
ncbi:MAG: histidine phosphatase family protein [Gammaproteobacteria bacterium]